MVSIIVGGIATYVFGFLWYGPIFGKKWVALMGFTPEYMAEAKKKSMGKSYVLAYIGAFVMAYVLSYFMSTLGISDIVGAWELVFSIWLGFVATVALNPVIWEGKSTELYFLNIFYYLVALFVMALIIVSLG